MGRNFWRWTTFCWQFHFSWHVSNVYQLFFMGKSNILRQLAQQGKWVQFRNFFYSQSPLGCIGILGPLSLALLSRGGNVVLHVSFPSFLVLCGHVLKPLLFLSSHSLQHTLLVSQVDMCNTNNCSTHWSQTFILHVKSKCIFLCKLSDERDMLPSTVLTTNDEFIVNTDEVNMSRLEKVYIGLCKMKVIWKRPNMRNVQWYSKKNSAVM